MCLSYNRESLDRSTDSTLTVDEVFLEVKILYVLSVPHLSLFLLRTHFSAGGRVQSPARYRSYKVRSDEKYESHFCSTVPSDQRSDNNPLTPEWGACRVKRATTQKMSSPSLVKTRERAIAYSRAGAMIVELGTGVRAVRTRTGLARASRISGA